MTSEDLHDIVDIDKIEPKSVRIEEKWSEESAAEQPGSRKTYTVTYGLPIPVSETWQYMFQRPGPMSGVVHRVDFEFSEDGTEVSTVVEREPGPELLIINGAEHFFHGRLTELRQAVMDFVEDHQ